MSQKIIRIGSSAGVTLNKSVLRACGLKHGDAVDVSVDDNQVIIAPTTLEEDRQTLKRIDQLLRKHQNELDKIND